MLNYLHIGHNILYMARIIDKDLLNMVKYLKNKRGSKGNKSAMKTIDWPVGADT